MPKFIVVLVMSSFILLTACTGQDIKRFNSVVSLNNHVSIKRHRQFVISPASHIALQVMLIPSSIAATPSDLRDKQLILSSFNKHFQRVKLFEKGDVIGDDFDFIVSVNLLSMVKRPEKRSVKDREVDKAMVSDAPMKTDVVVNKSTTNKMESINVQEESLSEVEVVAITSAPPFTPLQAILKLSLIDARSNLLIDVALIDSYSSSIRKPSFDNFLKATINRYANRITIM
jgi:hypothetical protein